MKQCRITKPYKQSQNEKSEKMLDNKKRMKLLASK